MNLGKMYLKYGFPPPAPPPPVGKGVTLTQAKRYMTNHDTAYFEAYVQNKKIAFKNRIRRLFMMTLLPYVGDPRKIAIDFAKNILDADMKDMPSVPSVPRRKLRRKGEKGENT